MLLDSLFKDLAQYRNQTDRSAGQSVVTRRWLHRWFKIQNSFPSCLNIFVILSMDCSVAIKKEIGVFSTIYPFPYFWTSSLTFCFQFLGRTWRKPSLTVVWCQPSKSGFLHYQIEVFLPWKFEKSFWRFCKRSASHACRVSIIYLAALLCIKLIFVRLIGT